MGEKGKEKGNRPEQKGKKKGRDPLESGSAPGNPGLSEREEREAKRFSSARKEKRTRTIGEGKRKKGRKRKSSCPLPKDGFISGKNKAPRGRGERRKNRTRYA